MKKPKWCLTNIEGRISPMREKIVILLYTLLFVVIASQVGAQIGDFSAVYAPIRKHSELFVKENDGYLHYRFVKDGAWQHDKTSFKASKVGGNISAVYAPQRQHSEVFFKGEDGFLHYFFVDGGAWKHDETSFKVNKVGGDISAVYSTQRQHSEVFFKGEDGFLHYFFFDGGVWKHDGNSFKDSKVMGAISAVYSSERSHSEVFFVSGIVKPMTCVNYFVQNGAWQHEDIYKGNPLSQSSPAISDISAVYAPQRKHSEVFISYKMDNIAYFYVQNGAWQEDKSSFGGSIGRGNDISAVYSEARGHSELFAFNNEVKLQYSFVQNGVWQRDKDSLTEPNFEIGYSENCENNFPPKIQQVIDKVSQAATKEISKKTKKRFQPFNAICIKKEGGGFYLFGNTGPGFEPPLPVWRQTVYVPITAKDRKYNFTIEKGGPIKAVDDVIKELKEFSDAASLFGFSRFDDLEKKVRDFQKKYGDFAICGAYSMRTGSFSFYFMAEGEGIENNALCTNIVNGISKFYPKDVYKFYGNSVKDEFSIIGFAKLTDLLKWPPDIDDLADLGDYASWNPADNCIILFYFFGTAKVTFY